MVFKKRINAIYISRLSLKNSRISNEKEIVELMNVLGVKVVYPERMSFKEQVLLFNSTDVIIGASGAALTNVIFAEKNTTLISLIPKKYEFHGYSSLAFICGLKTIFYKWSSRQNRN